MRWLKNESILLFSLNKPETILVRPQTQPIVRRLNTEKFKENWEQLKAESTDLVLISKEAGTYENSRLTGKYYEPKESGMTAGVQSATNEALKNNIMELFSNVDVTDVRSVNVAVERYKEMMRPAYIAYGMNDTHGSLTKVLNQDAANFRAQITKLTAAVNYRTTDYMA